MRGVHRFYGAQEGFKLLHYVFEYNNKTKIERRLYQQIYQQLRLLVGVYNCRSTVELALHLFDNDLTVTVVQ